MKHIFTFKSVFIALLVMSCSTEQEKIIEYETDGFRYILDTENREASLSGYSGDATKVVVSEKVTYKGKKYKVTSLGDRCFSECYSLVSIEIPSSVTSLGDGCFYHCYSLKAIDIPSSVTSLGDWCFTTCSSLKSVDIPSSVTSVGDICFSGCSSLVSIEIPSSVTSLGNECFENCSSLESIDIPSSVTSLGYACFAGCSSLKTVICKMGNVVSDNWFFWSTPIEEATLYVPEHLLETYKSTDPWSRFGNISPLAEEPEM